MCRLRTSSRVLRRLAPRQYSISSSSRVSPNVVALTMSVVRYASPPARSRGGVCSTFLADAPLGTLVPVHVQPTSHFPPGRRRAGDHGRPGHGGRAVRRVPRRPCGGGPHRAQLAVLRRAAPGDRLLLPRRASRLLSEGTLDRLATAFSRDQRAKVYVQDRMREHGARLWEWLEQGASFFVCGDASRMAKDVDAALREIVATRGGLGAAGPTPTSRNSSRRAGTCATCTDGRSGDLHADGVVPGGTVGDPALVDPSAGRPGRTPGRKLVVAAVRGRPGPRPLPPRVDAAVRRERGVAPAALLHPHLHPVTPRCCAQEVPATTTGPARRTSRASGPRCVTAS